MNWSFWIDHFISGEIAGIIGCFVCHPFDVIKTKFQLNPKKNKNVIFSAIQIWRKYHIRGFFRGLMFPMIGFGTIYSLVFGIKNISEIWLKHHIDNELKFHHIALSGAIAGYIVSFPYVFLERIKLVSQSTQLNSISTFRYLLREYGFLRGVCNGALATQLREVSHFTVYYPAYHFTLSLLILLQKPNYKHYQANQYLIWFSGAIAGITMWVSLYPIDVIKTRIQSSEPNSYKNLNDCLWNINKKEGINGFFGGLIPASIRAFILHSVIFLVFENTKHYLIENRKNKNF